MGSVADQCKACGMTCISQEIVNWSENALTDCFSTIVRSDSIWVRENRVIENTDFMREAFYAGRISRLYDSTSGV